ncbi:Hypothetical protein MVR_LOCUS268 [uncultured virus]|nr:Hypothetical protein MVR_LOCUS268 [uncultured virus]
MTVLERLGLADKYSPQYHPIVQEILLRPTDDVFMGNTLLCKIRSIIRKQAGGSMLEFDVAALHQAILRLKKIPLSYRLLASVNAETMASMSYVKRYIGDKVEILLGELSQSISQPIVSNLTWTMPHRAAILAFVTNIRRAVMIQILATRIHTLTLITAVDVDVGIKYQFMHMAYDSLCRDGYKDRYDAITSLTKHCLQNDVGIDTVWDIEGGLFWNILGHADRGSVSLLLLDVFAKQRLLFNYLLCSNKASLQTVCDSNPDVGAILMSAGRLPMTLDQKLTIASSWPSLLLLDLLGIDEDTISEMMPACELIVPQEQTSNQALTIEI